MFEKHAMALENTQLAGGARYGLKENHPLPRHQVCCPAEKQFDFGGLDHSPLTSMPSPTVHNA